MLVGAARFELATPSPPDWCANRAALRSANRQEADDLRPRARARKGGRARKGRGRHRPPEHTQDQEIIAPVVDRLTPRRLRLAACDVRLQLDHRRELLMRDGDVAIDRVVKAAGENE